MLPYSAELCQFFSVKKYFYLMTHIFFIRQARHFTGSFFLLHSSSIPSRDREKSYLTGSGGSSFLRASVISSAVFQSAVLRFVRPMYPEMRAMWVSSGITSFEGSMSFHIPKSSPSFLTIHRRYRFSLLHGLPRTGEGKRNRTPALRGSFFVPYIPPHPSFNALSEKDAREFFTFLSSGEQPLMKNPPILPHSFSICFAKYMRQTMSSPPVKRWVKVLNAPLYFEGLNATVNS